MNAVSNIAGSSLGKKYLMAVSGCVLFLFVVGHLLGNLQVFLGAEAINRYGYFLQSNVEVLWPVRVFLLLMLALHVWSATWLLDREQGSAAGGLRRVPAGGFELRVAHDDDERRHHFRFRDFTTCCITPCWCRR